MAVSKKAERQELKKPTQQQESNVAGNPSNRALTNAAEEDDVTPVPVFTGAQDNTDEDLIKFHASRIANGWHKSVGTILEVSKNCADADVKIPGHLKERFYKALLIDRTVFCKLAAIGRSQSLHNPDVLTSLPAHYSILYEARLLSPPELDRAIADKVVSPHANREEVARWASNPANCKLAASTKRHQRGFAHATKAGQAAEVEALKALWDAAPELVHKWRWSVPAVRDAFVREIKKDRKTPVRG